MHVSSILQDIIFVNEIHVDNLFWRMGKIRGLKFIEIEFDN